MSGIGFGPKVTDAATKIGSKVADETGQAAKTFTNTLSGKPLGAAGLSAKQVQITAQLSDLEFAGKQNSPEYKALKQELGTINKQIAEKLNATFQALG